MSKIASALSGRTLLVTGATGFLAKAFVAKVVRDLPGVERIVLLLRGRKRPDGTTVPAAERLEREVLGSSAFRRLRAELGDAFDETLRAKVSAVEGDLTREGLGLAPGSERALEGVDAIVNSAATVVFDERVDHALAINTLGVRRLLALARERGGIPLLHVSTAYTCGRRRGVIPEEPPALDRAVIDDLEGRARGTLDLDAEVAALVALAAGVEAEVDAPAVARRLEREASRGGASLEELRRRWVKDRLVDAGMARARERGWNDTYTYTKSLGERVLLRERGDVPACIVRPSIIESGLREPEPGWIDGLRMADPLFAAYGKGVLKRIPSDPDSVIDFIPVDHVVNAMLAALARLVEEPPARGQVPVYHVATSTANPLVFRRLFDLTRGYFLEHPFKDRRGRPIVPSPSMFTGDARFQRDMRRVMGLVRAGEAVLDRLPGAAPARGRARLARMRAQLDRILYYVRIYGPYTSFPARFDTRRTEELRAWLEPAERASFDFDARGFDWETYVQDVHLPGLLRNVLREPAPAPMAHSAASAIPEEGTVTGRTVVDLVVESARAHGDRVALRAVSGRSLTHRMLLEQALGGAAALRAAGVGRGDRVLLVSENRPEWPVAWLAIACAGATAVPLDAQSSGSRIADILRAADARAVVASRRLAETLPPGAGPVVLVEELAGHALPIDDARAAGLPVAISPEQAASILFTSGTTLDPKGVVLPHRAFVANVESIREVLEPTEDDRLVSVLPLHHAFEFTAGLLAPLSAGASITYLETVSGPAIVDALRETRATVLLGVPRLYELMLDGIRRQLAELSGGASAALGALRGTSRAFNAMGLNAGRTLLSPLHARFGGSLRVLVSGGAALDPHVQEEFRALGFTLVEGYGLTECAPVLTVNPPSAPRAGSVGKPLPGVDVRIHRPGADGVGEIVVRGPNVMAGYYKDAASTAQVLRDGWLHTGDLGRFDPDGYLRVVGRLKDLIVTGAGKNVHPDEVEEALGDLPHVKESCVVGVRARAGAGEEVHLVVVLDGEPDEARLAEVRAAVARACEAMPTHQRVQRVHAWTQELPKTALQKVKRGVVRAELEGVAVDAPRPGAGGGSVSTDPVAREALALLARLARVAPESLSPQQNLAFDLGVDSLMLVEIVAAIEARTGLKAPDEAAKELVTVRDLAALAERLGASRAPRSAAPARANGTAPPDARRSLLARTAAPIVRTAWPVFYGQYLRLQVHGREHLPREGAYIVAANHQSHLDAGAVLTAMGADARRLHVVAARDYFFDTPWKGGFFAELLNAIPFDRHGDFEDGLASCRTALRSGDPLLIFPEGTRSPDGRLQEFKAGLGVLALELGIPVVPTRIDGTHEALPKGSSIPRPRPVRVTFGRLVQPAELPPDAGALAYERYRAFVELVRHRIVELAAPAPAGVAP